MQMHTAVLEKSDVEMALGELVTEIVQLSANPNSVIFTAGNGGSAATADHFSADLALTNKRVGTRVRSVCLNSHLALNSALANDIGYEYALAEQLENFNSQNNSLVVFSASGNSKNLLRLLDVADTSGVSSWAFLGFDGGQISHLKTTRSITFPDELKNYGVAENLHLMAAHYVVDQVNSALKKKL